MKVGMLILAPLVFLISGLPGVSPRAAITQPEGGRSFGGPTWTADSSDSSKAPPPYTSEGQLRVFVNKAFNVGEKLNYDIYYGPIVAGSATIETPSAVYFKGRK